MINPDVFAYKTKEFDDLDYKTPIHKYLVLKSTRCPISVEDVDNEFEPGTLVRHIEMNINHITE